MGLGLECWIDGLLGVQGRVYNVDGVQVSGGLLGFQLISHKMEYLNMCSRKKLMRVW